MSAPRHLLGVRLDPPLIAQLDAYCAATHHTRRQVIELALEAYLGRPAAATPVAHDPRQTELFPTEGADPCN